MNNRPIFTFRTSIGITVMVIDQFNDIPLRGLYLLEIDPSLIVNTEVLSLKRLECQPENAGAYAMGVCSEIEAMALEMSRPPIVSAIPVIPPCPPKEFDYTPIMAINAYEDPAYAEIPIYVRSGDDYKKVETLTYAMDGTTYVGHDFDVMTTDLNIDRVSRYFNLYVVNQDTCPHEWHTIEHLDTDEDVCRHCGKRMDHDAIHRVQS